MITRVVMSFLKEINSIIEPFFISREDYIFSPHAFLIFTLALVIYSSFLGSIQSLIVILILGTIFLFLISHNKFKTLEILFIIIAFNSFVALPKLLYLYELNDDVILFLLRTLVSGIFSLIGIEYLGVSGFLSGLKKLGIPERYVIVLYMFLYNIVILSREGFKVLLARLSRAYDPNRRSIWKLMASTVAFILLKAKYKAKMQYNSMKIRGGLSIETPKSSPFDLILYVMVILCLLSLLI